MSEERYGRHTLRRRIFSIEAAGDVSESSESESSGEEEVAERSMLSDGIMSIASRISTC